MKLSGREKPEPDKSSWLRYCGLYLFVLYIIASFVPRSHPVFCLTYSAESWGGPGNETAL